MIDTAFRAAFGPRVTSTTLTVAWVAAGRRAGDVSDGRFVDNVHFAAGIQFCRAAGCIVTDLVGAELETGRGLIMGADAPTHHQLLSIVARHLEAWAQP